MPMVVNPNPERESQASTSMTRLGFEADQTTRAVQVVDGRGRLPLTLVVAVCVIVAAVAVAADAEAESRIGGIGWRGATKPSVTGGRSAEGETWKLPAASFGGTSTRYVHLYALCTVSSVTSSFQGVFCFFFLVNKTSTDGEGFRRAEW